MIKNNSRNDIDMEQDGRDKPIQPVAFKHRIRQLAQYRCVGICLSVLLVLSTASQAANVSGVSASPNPFDNNSQTTTISYTLSNAALTWLKIYDNGNVLKRDLVTPASYTTTNKSAGANSDIWNGRDNASSLVPFGTYPYHIDNAFYSADYSTSPGSSPQDIAVDPSNPNILWMTNKAASNYTMKSTNGGASWSAVSSGADAKAYGIVTSSDGQTIYIADDGQSGLIKSTNGGTSWGLTTSFPSGRTNVVDVATDSTGQVLYAVNGNYASPVIFYSSNGGSSWSTCAASGLTLSSTSAWGIATDSAGTTVIVNDAVANKVWKSTNSCSSFSQVTAIGSGTAAGQVSYPYHVSIQSDGSFWISERDNNRIQQFDANGNSLMVIGGTTTGAGNYQFNSGAKYFGIGLATISSQPYIFVADYNNNRIKKIGYDNWVSATPITVATTTTLGNGTDPGNAALAPGGAATMADAFTFQASSGTDSITNVTVTLAAGTSGGLSLVEITNSAGSAVYGSVSNPATDTPTITLSGLTATTTLTTYKIRVTPKSHANMPAPPGSTYSVTAYISNWTGTNSHVGTDSGGTTVTIDNLSPGDVTGATASAGNAQVSLAWTNPGDADLNSIIVLRKTGSAVADTPVEGTTYTVGNTIGTSTVACVVSTPTASCTDTGLTNGTAYYYKIFTKDSNGNYSATGATPTGSPATPTAPTNTTYYWNTNTGTTVATGVTTDWNGCTVKPSTTRTTLMTTTGYNCGDDEVNLAAAGTFWEAYYNTAYASNTTVTGVTFKAQVESSNYSSNTFRVTLFYITAGGTKTDLGFVNFTTPAKAVQTINISSISGTVPSGAKLGVRTQGISNITRVRTGGTGTTGAFFGELVVSEAAATTTTLGNGTDPGNASLAPGGAATMADAFTFQTSGGTDTITDVTVTLAAGTSGGLSLVEITDSAGATVYGSVTNPGSDTPTITLNTNTLTATTTLTTYKIRVTPKSHANMPAPAGSTYSVTAYISNWTGTNGHAGSDSGGTTVTIDNLSPGNVTGATATAGNQQVALAWTNPGDADLNSIIVLRRTGGVVADTPVEGTTYSVGNTVGSSTVVCVVASPGTSCTDTALTGGTAYYYKIFTKDSNGNYSATGVVPTGSPATPTAPSISATKLSAVISDPVNGGTNPKRIPGSVIEYSIVTSNNGNGTADNNSTYVTDAIDTANLTFNATNGVTFTQGATTSGLALGTVSYSNTAAPGPYVYTYTPVPDGNGYDANITAVKITTTGTFAAGGGPAPSFTLKFRVMVK